MTGHTQGLDSERILDQIFDESPSFMCFLRGPEFVFERANEQYMKLIGRREIIGKRLLDVVPEAETQGFTNLLADVYKTKKPFVGKEVPFSLSDETGKIKQVFVDFVYQALTDSSGEVYGIAAQGFEVTEKVLARQEIERTRDAIQNERENFRNLFQQTPQFVAILAGPDHRFEFVNETHVQMLGVNTTGKTVREAHPESVEIFEILDEVYRTGKTAQFLEIPITIGDRLRYFDVTYSARRDLDGTINGIMVLGIETTARVDARSEMQKNRSQTERLLSDLESKSAQLEAIIEHIPMSVIVAEAPSGKLLFSNKQFESVYRYPFIPSDTIDGYQEYVGFHPDGRRYEGRDWPLARTLLSGQTILGEDTDVQLGDGSRAILSLSSAPVRNGRGEMVAAIVISENVTDRRRHEKNLKEAKDEAERAREELYSFFMQAPAPMVIFTGPEHRFTLANPLYEKYVGRKVTGKNVRDVFTEEEVGYYTTLLDRVYQTGEPFVGKDLPLTLNDDNGETKFARIDVSYTPFRDSSGEVKGILVFIQDVTEEYNARTKMKNYTQELELAKSEADRANELKSAFLANMSHEIRTPLGAMLGFADLLRDLNLSKVEHSNYIDILVRNGEQLSTIINDILDLSKVEAGHLALELDAINPEGIVVDVVSLLRVKAKEKGLGLEFEMDSSIPSQLVTDGTRLRQILLNIVGNAIKFTSAGSVTIRGYGTKFESGVRSVVFEVQDTGIGIPESQVGNLFEMFVQGDGSMSRRFGGTGLGLALSRQLARVLGGDVSILKTEEGKGTTFHISIADQPERKSALPFAQEQVAPVELATNALENVRVLVVDDAADNRHLISRYLTKRGATVDSAVNGLEGCRQALAGDYDILIMDIQMPEMDGYTATQKLRSTGYTKPIIALTAHAMTEVRKKCLNVGCTDHLPKPINAKDLVGLVAKYARER